MRNANKFVQQVKNVFNFILFSPTFGNQQNSNTVKVKYDTACQHEIQSACIDAVFNFVADESTIL